MYAGKNMYEINFLNNECDMEDEEDDMEDHDYDKEDFEYCSIYVLDEV